MPGDLGALSSGATQTALPSGATLMKERYEIRHTLTLGNDGMPYRSWDSSLQAYVAIKEYLQWDCSAFRN